MNIHEALTIELVKNTKAIDLFNDLKTFNYEDIAIINGAITSAFVGSKMQNLWMHNNHKQALCISPTWLIRSLKGHYVTVLVKAFSSECFSVCIQFKTDNPLQGVLVSLSVTCKSVAGVISALLTHSQAIHTYINSNDPMKIKEYNL